MKTGEVLVNIKKEDVKTLFINFLNLEANKLCPFAETLSESIDKSADIPAIDALIKNNDIVYLIKNLAKPDSLLQFRVGGPGLAYNKISICKTAESTYILLLFDGNSFGIQYYDSSKALAEILTSLIINSDFDEQPDAFPATLNYESLILYFNIIDSFRLISYRNTLNHESNSLFKIASSGFNDLLKDSIQKLDFRWLLSNLLFFLPSVVKFDIQGNAKNYEELFEKGFLISVTDKNTNANSLLLDVKSIDLGAEFFELWYKSAGVQYSYFKEGVIETNPLAFIAVTGTSNHYFQFDENSDSLIYQNMGVHASAKVFTGFIEKLINKSIAEKSVVETKPKFCSKCGTKIPAGAKFCSKCGNHVF